MKNALVSCFILIVIGCNNQYKEKKQNVNGAETTEQVQPKEMTKVEKKYDDQGNLIAYDSIYTWTYSNIKGDSIRINLDSIMDTFKNYFKNTMPFNENMYFSYFPKNDTLFMKDFFKKDYFFDNWKKDNSQLDRIIMEMDSVRNSFLRKFHPGLMESNDKK